MAHRWAIFNNVLIIHVSSKSGKFCDKLSHFYSGSFVHILYVTTCKEYGTGQAMYV